ncbi:DUF6503 family protein [Roseivirga sp.]|uniref:DUF6503 family protein n=1 Tax=Roseivirga sp. TaxID=1964215 RepID=UPI002B27A84A|nr:DUF6503 family protein [Roseivirga sp.]
MKKYLIVFLMTALMGCGGTKTENKIEEVKVDPPKTDHHSASITKVFDAHGGFGNWSEMKQLSYDMSNGQHHLIELQSRFTRIESENDTIGFDGNEVWVMPATANASRARMTYNLYFYFYAFPFVVGDQGVMYEDVEPMNILGTTYNAVKVSYESGVGESSKDNYIIYSDPETNKMAWLMYTATFGAETTSDRWSLIKYDQWQTINGITIPKALQWYQYKDGEVGGMRNEVLFENVKLSKEVPSMDNFKMPEGAQIAPKG